MVLPARRFDRQLWPFYALFLLVACGNTLVIASHENINLVMPVSVGIVVMLTVGAFHGLRDFVEETLGYIRRGNDSPKSKSKAVQLLSVGCLFLSFVGVFFASLPLSRPDAWTYHLNVSKTLGNFGKLMLPMLNDHIYFAGVYEYWLVLFRLFSSNDLVVQSATNTFTLMFIGSLLVGGFRCLALPGSSRPVFWPLLFAFTIYAIPDFDMITSAKPDGFFIPFSLFILLLLVRSVANQNFRSAMLFSFAAILPIGLKPTWLLQATALCLAGIMLVPISEHRLPRKQWFFGAILGGILGLIVNAPFFVKNYQYFANPLHPAQLLFFKSTPWTDEMALYWQNIARPPREFLPWLKNLAGVLLVVPQRTALILLPGLLLTFATVMIKRRYATVKDQVPLINESAEKKQRELLLVAASVGGLIFVIFWSVVYRHDIYARFMYPLLGNIFVLCILWLQHQYSLVQRLMASRSFLWFKSPSTLLCAFLGLVPAINGSMEVRLLAIAKAWSQDTEDFFAKGKWPLQEQYIYTKFNEHLRSRSTAGSFVSRSVLLTDNPSGYFFNGEILSLHNYQWGYFRDRYTIEASGTSGTSSIFCLWRFVRDLNIQYLLSFEDPFSTWDSSLQPLIEASEAIDHEPKWRYLPPQVVEQRLSADPMVCSRLSLN